jgi:hypothetical protein
MNEGGKPRCFSPTIPYLFPTFPQKRRKWGFFVVTYFFMRNFAPAKRGEGALRRLAITQSTSKDMKKNMKPNEDAFIEACQKMHNAANICHNWLNLSYPHATMAIKIEQGYMKSIRLALLEPGSQMVTTKSAVQIAVIPAVFDGVTEKRFERKEWQLMVYSWLGKELTQRLLEHLKSKIDCDNVKCLLVHPNECLPL